MGAKTIIRQKAIKFKKQTQMFTGFVAEIIQHECDHLEGKII